MSGWAAVLPLIGVAVGALLQHWLSRSAEERKQLQLLRSQAHVDYLRAVARAAHAHSSDAQRAAKADAADAKARIAVYATADVVQALARFETAGATLTNPHSNQCFLALVSTMREVVGKADAEDLRLVLLGPQPTTVAQLDLAPATKQ